MRKPNYYKKAIEILQELHTAYPNFGLARHITTALSDYGDFWGLSDKELSFALEKYQAELSLDINQVVDDAYVEKVVKGSMNLDTLLENEEDGY
jgi:hypothetical protein